MPQNISSIADLLESFLVFILIFFAFLIAFYILSGIGLMKIADRMGEKNSWMAWVPFLSQYLIGKLAIDNIIGILISFCYALVLCDNFDKLPSVLAPIIGLIYIIHLVLIFVSYYKIYKRFSEKAVLMIVLTVITFNLIAPVFLFAIRNNPIIELDDEL